MEGIVGPGQVKGMGDEDGERLGWKWEGEEKIGKWGGGGGGGGWEGVWG